MQTAYNHQAKINNIITFKEFLYARGYGINCAWIISILQFAIVSRHSHFASDSSVVIYIVMSLVFLTVGLIGKKLTSVFDKKEFRWIVATILCIVTIIMMLFNMVGVNKDIAFNIGAIFIGIGSPLIFMTWAKVFAQLNAKELIISNVLSFLLNAIVIIITQLFEHLPNGLLVGILPIISVSVLTFIDYKFITSYSSSLITKGQPKFHSNQFNFKLVCFVTTAFLIFCISEGTRIFSGGGGLLIA